MSDLPAPDAPPPPPPPPPPRSAQVEQAPQQHEATLVSGETELDDLLGELKLSQEDRSATVEALPPAPPPRAQPPPPSAPPKSPVVNRKAAEENLSGVTKSDHCQACHKAITADFIALKGRRFHVGCFTCDDCAKSIGTSPFFELNGRRCCESCYTNSHASKCAVCNGAIRGQIVSALNKKYHPEHFTCGKCRKPFASNAFYEHNGVPYCDFDFADLTGTRCDACQQPIDGDVVKAMGKAWHPQHFVCASCKTQLDGFHAHEGKPYCDQHNPAQKPRESCHACGRSITTTALVALNKKYHPDCFKCGRCQASLGKGYFEHQGQPLCQSCADKS